MLWKACLKSNFSRIFLNMKTYSLPTELNKPNKSSNSFHDGPKSDDGMLILFIDDKKIYMGRGQLAASYARWPNHTDWPSWYFRLGSIKL